MAETLKEYLVKLGWNVDELGLRKAEDAIDNFGGKADTAIGKITGGFVSATLAVGEFLFAAVSSMTRILDATAQADLAVERFARRMWTTEESARSFLSALDAMDADYQDIFYMTPEEYKRFMDLRDLGNSLKAPVGLQEGLKLVRDIRGEFQKLKVTVNYATQWVSYYLTKMLGTDLENILNGFKNFNDWIRNNIPVATEKIAKFLTIIYKMGKTAINTLAWLYESFKDFFDMLSPKAKTAGAAILGFVGLLKLGPIGAFIAGLLALLLILDDISVWMQGGKSAYGDTYEKLANMFSSWDTSGVDDLKEKLAQLLDTLGKVLSAIWDIGAAIFDFLEDIGVFEAAWNILLGTLNTVADALQTILDLILLITGHAEDMSKDGLLSKLIKFDENGEFDLGATVKNALFGEVQNDLLDSAHDFAKMPFNPLSGLVNIYDSVTGGGSEKAASVYISRNKSGVSSEMEVSGAGTSSSSSGRQFDFGKNGIVPERKVTQTQTNNINIYSSDTDAAKKTADSILKQRNFFDPFK